MTEWNGELPPPAFSSTAFNRESKAIAYYEADQVRTAIAQAVARETAPLREALQQVRADMTAQDVLFEWWGQIDALLGGRPDLADTSEPKDDTQDRYDMACLSLPHDVKVGGNVFRKGVNLETFIAAAQGWHRVAFPEGYELTPEQKAANFSKLVEAPNPGHPQQGEPYVRWTDKWDCKHVLSLASAARMLSAYYDEWPGGLEEIESALKTAAASVQASAGQDERSRFEAHWYEFYNAGQITARDDGSYKNLTAQYAWEAWQARAAQPATKGSGDAGYHVFLDGDQWCAVGPGFVNIQESLCAFADLPVDALRLLREAEGDEKRRISRLTTNAAKGGE